MHDKIKRWLDAHDARWHGEITNPDGTGTSTRYILLNGAQILVVKHPNGKESVFASPAYTLDLDKKLKILTEVIK